MISNDMLLLLHSRRKGRPRARLWGVADLHSHPATFMAFGSDTNGNDGPIWGKPGVRPSPSTIATDLPACDGFKHSGMSLDAINHGSRNGVVAVIEGLEPGACHGTAGSPTFDSWPSATSISHQQMHVSAIHRAWRGGLRLLVATAVDNQVLHMLWHRHYAAGAPTPITDGTFDYDSAVAQLTWLKTMVSNNSEWMSIALTPADAEVAIRSGRLAMILGVEMCGLLTWQIKRLIRDHGVRVVTPIHLIDNAYGGAAVYDDNFNAANFYVNGRFFDVTSDARILFRFPEHPSFLRYISNNVFEGGDLTKWGAMLPDVYPDVVYPSSSLGHRNARGLADENSMLELMCEGVLLDVSHMSQNSVDATIRIAKNRGNYPLMATHCGLRPEKGRAGSERELMRDHAKAIASLGGVLGLGTGYAAEKANSPVQRWAEEYRDAQKLLNSAVALGTDMNGLNRQIGRTEVLGDIAEFSIPSPEMGSGQGSNVFCNNDANGLPSGPSDFYRGGLSHYGMLPEFLYAVASESRFDPSNLEIFRSADVTVKMWRLVATRTSAEFQGRSFPALNVTLHIGGLGDRTYHENQFAGARGQGWRVEGFQIDFQPSIGGLGLRYMAHLQGTGDTAYVSEGHFIGTRGENRQLEGFAIELTGDSASRYSVSYLAHVQNIGDVYGRDGEFCGTRGGGMRVEGISVRIVLR